MLYRAEPGSDILRKRGFGTTDEALAFAKKQDARGCDAWFGCALFDSANKNQANVKSVRGFWLDLDVEAGNAHKYESQMEALRTLKEFCKEHSVPAPTIVDSGYGIHVYWLLTTSLTHTQWTPIAKRLRKALMMAGVKQDPKRTTDSSSIMRIPGLHNHKRDPKPVRLLREAPAISLEEFTAWLPVDVEATNKAFETGSANPSFPPATSEGIEQKCAVIKAIASTGGADADEPLWYATLGVAAHCKDSEAAAIRWSQGHPDFDKATTLHKLEQWKSKSKGPALCSTFETMRPEMCAGCPLRGKISTPAQLGATVTPEPKATVTERPTKVGDYRVGVEGVVFLPVDGAPVLVTRTPIHIDSIGYNDEHVAVAAMSWTTPAGGKRQAELPLSITGEKKEMRKWLRSNAIMGGNTESIMSYINDYATMVLATNDPSKNYDKFGWVGAKRFVIGDRELTKDSSHDIRLAPRVSGNMRSEYTPKGDRDAWIEATKIFAKPGYEPHAFAVLAAMAAPILNIMDVQGAVLSLAGPSGTAKTTSARFGCSTYCAAKHTVLPAHSTDNGIDEALRTANNLPVLLDDVSAKYSRRLSSLIYMAANGRAKVRSTVTGAIKDQNTWQTFLIVTTNNPILDLPDSIIAEAERRRVLELSVVEPMTEKDARTLNNVMNANYGVVGDEFLQVLIRHRVKIAEMTAKIYERFASDSSIHPANRFGLWLCTAAYVAGALARKEGLIQFDPKPAVEHALATLRTTNQEIMDPAELIKQELAAFVSTNNGKISYKRGREFVNSDITQRAAVVAVYSITDSMLYIPMYRFKLWLGERNVPSISLKMWRDANNITAKTTVMFHNGPGEYCLCVPYTLGEPDDSTDLQTD